MRERAEWRHLLIASCKQNNFSERQVPLVVHTIKIQAFILLFIRASAVEPSGRCKAESPLAKLLGA
jgi:hypothetical protein